MLEIYNKLKIDYPKSIVLIKSGSFYITLNNDAIIMNKLFNYQIKPLTRYKRLGFPINSLSKVTSKLTNDKIDYIIYEDKIINKIKFNKNNYNKYINETLDYELIIHKINFINNKLKTNIFSDNILDVLNDMERLLCQIKIN